MGLRIRSIEKTIKTTWLVKDRSHLMLLSHKVENPPNWCDLEIMGNWERETAVAMNITHVSVSFHLESSPNLDISCFITTDIQKNHKQTYFIIKN